MREVVDLNRMTLAQKRFDVGRMAKVLNDAYMADGREPSAKAKKSFAPSSLGYGAGKCPRRWFYDFSGGVVREDSFDPMGIANMAYGTEAHARIQELFNRAGILIEAERKVVTPFDDPVLPPVFGFADLVVKWQGEDVVGEIKTTGQESYVSKLSKGQPAGYHLLQVLIYMKVLKLNKGFLLYENKNTQTMMIVPVVWNVANTKLIDDTFAWMNEVYATWKDGKKPTRPFRSEKSVVCKTCPYLKHCWQVDEEVGEVTLPVLEVPA